jgi:hypothetical protein
MVELRVPRLQGTRVLEVRVGFLEFWWVLTQEDVSEIEIIVRVLGMQIDSHLKWLLGTIDVALVVLCKAPVFVVEWQVFFDLRRLILLVDLILFSYGFVEWAFGIQHFIRFELWQAKIVQVVGSCFSWLCDSIIELIDTLVNLALDSSVGDSQLELNLVLKSISFA